MKRNVGEACHMYDVFRFLAGAPVRSVDASAIDPRELPYARSDNFAATITYEDGTVASLVYTALGPKTGLGKEHITAERMAHLKKTLPADERRTLVKDMKRAPAWMHPIMRELAGA